MIRGKTIGRVLTCIRCGANVDVIEAAQGATTELEHRWIDPSAFVCGECLEAAGDTVTGIAA